MVLQRAFRAARKLFADLRFCECQSEEARREFIQGIWTDKERDVIGLLMHRACEIMAARAGLTVDEVEARILKEAA